jgi:hypothetical protein
VLSGIYSANSFSKGSLRTFPKGQKATDGAPPGFLIQSESEFSAKLKHPGKKICREAEAFSVEQIVAILKQVEVGVPVAEPIRQAGISEQTFIAGRNSMLGWRWTRFASCV